MTQLEVEAELDATVDLGNGKTVEIDVDVDIEVDTSSKGSSKKGGKKRNTDWVDRLAGTAASYTFFTARVPEKCHTGKKFIYTSTGPRVVPFSTGAKAAQAAKKKHMVRGMTEYRYHYKGQKAVHATSSMAEKNYGGCRPYTIYDPRNNMAAPKAKDMKYTSNLHYLFEQCDEVPKTENQMMYVARDYRMSNNPGKTCEKVCLWYDIARAAPRTMLTSNGWNPSCHVSYPALGRECVDVNVVRQKGLKL